MAGIYSNGASGASAAAPSRSSQYDRDVEDAVEGQMQGKKTGLGGWGGAPQKPHTHHHHNHQAERPQQTGAGIAVAADVAAAPANAEEVRLAIGSMFSQSRTHEVPFSVGADYSPADIAAGKLLTLDMVAAAKMIGVNITPGMTMIVEGLRVTEASSNLPVLAGAEFVGLPDATYHSGPNGTGTTYHVALGSRDIPSQTSRINAYILEAKVSESIPAHQMKIWGKFSSAEDMRSDLSTHPDGDVAYIRAETRLYTSLTTPIMAEDGKTQVAKSLAGQFGDAAAVYSFKNGGKGMIVKLDTINAAIEQLDTALFQKQAFQSKRADATKLDIAVKLLNTAATAEHLPQHNKEDATTQMRELERGSDIHISGKITITLLE